MLFHRPGLFRQLDGLGGNRREGLQSPQGALVKGGGLEMGPNDNSGFVNSVQGQDPTRQERFGRAAAGFVPSNEPAEVSSQNGFAVENLG